MKKEPTFHDIIQQIFAHNDNQEKILKDSPSDFNFNNCGSDNDTQLNTKIKNEKSKTLDPQTKRHFVEIGEYSCGSIFGLGEHMDDRVIVAKHKAVQCLLIPHYWLFQKKQNAGNIWQRWKKLTNIFAFISVEKKNKWKLMRNFINRSKIYLDFTLPSRKDVFQHYLEAKKWKSYKNKLIYNTGKLKPQINSTQIEDVPILCRLNNSLWKYSAKENWRIIDRYTKAYTHTHAHSASTIILHILFISFYFILLLNNSFFWMEFRVLQCIL